MIKKITTALYVLIIVLMAAASIIENYNGTPINIFMEVGGLA